MARGQVGQADVESGPSREQLRYHASQRGAGGRITIGEIFERGNVGRAREQLDDRRRAVPTRPADLLAVALQALWQVVVIDVAHVGFVDAHAEGNGRHHDRPIGRRPPFLNGGAARCVHAGVVGAGW